MAKVHAVIKQLNKILQPYDIRVEPGNPHCRVINVRTKKRISSLSGSPSCPYFARHLIEDLVKEGILPKELKKRKIVL